MSDFNRKAGKKLDIKVASLDALDAVKEQRGRICPLICGRNQHVEGDECVANPVERKPPPRKEASRPPEPSPRERARERAKERVQQERVRERRRSLAPGARIVPVRLLAVPAGRPHVLRNHARTRPVAHFLSVAADRAAIRLCFQGGRGKPRQLVV